MKTQRSGFSLVVAGVAGVVFFWWTDPGRAAREARPPYDYSVLDRVNEAAAGTRVGVAGSAALLLIGLWLLTRRSV